MIRKLRHVVLYYVPPCQSIRLVCAPPCQSIRLVCVPSCQNIRLVCAPPCQLVSFPGSRSHTRPLPSRVLVEVAGALTIHFYRLLAHARPLSEKPRVSVRASPLRLHRSGSYMLVEPSLFSTVTRIKYMRR